MIRFWLRNSALAINSFAEHSAQQLTQSGSAMAFFQPFYGETRPLLMLGLDFLKFVSHPRIVKGYVCGADLKSALRAN